MNFGLDKHSTTIIAFLARSGRQHSYSCNNNICSHLYFSLAGHHSQSTAPHTSHSSLSLQSSSGHSDIAGVSVSNNAARAKAYSTIALKPAIMLELQKITDRYYPGMFLPSTLIIMMNEVKRGDYLIDMYSIRSDFTGRYVSLSVRSDVKNWLQENYNNLKEQYRQKYGSKNFSTFVAPFLMNLIRSKSASQENVIRLKEADFIWLSDEYSKRKQEYTIKYGIFTFEQFVDFFLKQLLQKVNAARLVLES